MRLYVQLSVTNARFVKKRCIFLLSCRIVGFFYQNTKVRTSFESKPYQPVKWRVYRATNKKEFKIEIARSIPHIGLVVNDGQTC